MREKRAESISALMDNEVEELELRRLLKELDGEDRVQWRRYHIARSAMADDGGSGFANIDISAAVSKAISDEPNMGRARSVLRAVGSFAVAASVTLAVMVGLRVYNTQIQPAVDEIAAVEQARSPAQGVELPAITLDRGGETYASYGSKLRVAQPNSRGQESTARAVVRQVSPYAQQRLQYYMLEHAHQASFNANQGIIPYARVSDFEGGRP